ncbi:uncharacterized protein HMPREF1541_03741 [Cyphellophora europaea CBS 101466]|uniref:Amidohydrolase-related domain-containing protein n=1 Tax=Cyphellophora europaea (strain CBS 101466) TaxID=1220924 RepID=W2S1F8_CYPE1|nr:uncharacterized protein HMPREF1541_03741 [Cyphellophora europaea CBS 101466]ETN41804.1 hypothetical protein HMPREF1541_03741 [Cyphellophora europaea CBS 101466]
MAEVNYDKPWAPTSAVPSITLINASLVDVRQGRIVSNTTITLSNGKIDKVGGNSSESASIDLQGKYICPGLSDCHVHVTGAPGGLSFKTLYNHPASAIHLRASYVLKTMLLRGFTTIRDTGGADAGLRAAVDEGLIPGPRMVIAGRALSQTGGHGDFRDAHDSRTPSCCGDTPSLGRICDGVPQCLEASRDELRRGADFIKIMCGGGMASPNDPLDMLQFTPEEIRAITTTTSYLDTYTTAHAYTPRAIRHAVDNGVLGIEHANFIDVETAELCVAKGVTFTPTLGTYEAFSKAPFDTLLDQQNKEKLRVIVASGRKSLEIMKQTGAKVCYGSDLLGGAHYQQSSGFRLLNQVFSPAEVLRCATINAAEPLRKVGQLGALEAGMVADLLVLDRNPLEDITILERPEETILAIVKDGRVVTSKVEGLEQDALYRGF